MYWNDPIRPSRPSRNSWFVKPFESEPLSLPAGLAAPALFTAGGSGLGQAAALNQDGTLNSVANPASAGSIVTVYGTGFGATAPISKDGVLMGSDQYGIALPVKVAVGGKEAKVTYGSAPGLVAGVSQVNFREAALQWP